jgi:7,8-dihydroneopterin aldolase/epimerase/oxygenase
MSKLASIQIKDLSVQALIGVYEFERTQTQELLISLTLSFDAEKACHSDNISDTLDYAALCEGMDKICQDSSFQLLEALGLALTNYIQSFPSILSYKLKINKPNAVKNAKETALIFESETVQG